MMVYRSAMSHKPCTMTLTDCTRVVSRLCVSVVRPPCFNFSNATDTAPSKCLEQLFVPSMRGMIRISNIAAMMIDKSVES